MYEAETPMLLKTKRKRIEAFGTCRRTYLEIPWKEKVKNEEVYMRTNEQYGKRSEKGGKKRIGHIMRNNERQ